MPVISQSQLQKDVSFNTEKMFVFYTTFKLFGAETGVTEIQQG